VNVNEWYKWKNGNLILELQVQPGAGYAGFAGIHGDRIKLRVRAPARDCKANDALIKLLAGQFDVARSRITIERGLGSRKKTVCIRDPARLPDLPGLTTHDDDCRHDHNNDNPGRT
jgi:uncharacterized protein (TIGR00251 family)